MLELLVCFLLGGGAYAGLELSWRGSTHWSMFWVGGAGLCLLRQTSLCALPFALQAALGAATLTLLELASGLVLNRLLGWQVWDYSHLPGNLWGQVCPQYFLCWLALSAGCIAFFRWMDAKSPPL